MFQYNTIDEFCTVMANESYLVIGILGIFALFFMISSLICSVSELVTKAHPDFDIPVASFFFNLVVGLAFFALSTIVLECHYKDNITIKDFTSDFEYMTLITDKGSYEGYLRTSEWLDQDACSDNNVTVYSDKNGYIIAELRDHCLYINNNAIAESSIEDLKMESKDEEVINNGVIKIAGK